MARLWPHLSTARRSKSATPSRVVRYLFIGKSGAILLGYPDTTQDAHLFLQKSPKNGRAVVTALRELGFGLTEAEAADITRGKDFVQLRNGPFDLDLVFAPDGIEHFDEAWSRHVDVEGFPVCHLDDISEQSGGESREGPREPSAASGVS